jgi:hypothetical protein
MQLSITVLSQTGGHGDNWEVCGAHMPGVMDEHPGRPHNIVDDQLGTLEVGKSADAVVFTGNELELSDMRSRVSQVFKPATSSSADS